MELWEEKLIDNFGTAVVNKKLALEHQIKGLPRYVSEYLLGYFCKDGINETNLREMYDYIRKHLISSKEKEKAKHELQMELKKKIIDKFKVTINLTNKKEKQNNLEIPSLGEKKATVYNSILKEHPRLLIDGIWGLAQIEFEPLNKEIRMTKFKPFQLSDIDLDEYIEVRKAFTTDEWINALISTIGLDYRNYDFRKKLILISRLIPMVEKNVFMMEFGLPGTGKTYAFEQISAYTRVISGSKITEAQLFYNLRTNQEGLLCQYDAVVFDEIDKVKNTGIDDKVVNKLYQYLASGKFDRGGVEKNSTCGIVMVGNMPKEQVELENLLGTLLHETLIHDAFMDRLTGVIPGWELDSIANKEKSLTKHYGFTADYFSEILNKLRSIEFRQLIKSKIKLDNASIRDEDAVEKIISGLIKLIYPHGEIIDEEFKQIIEYAIELRQFVINQKYSIHRKEEYNKKLSYEFRK